MILVTDVRFRAPINLPGGDVHRAISTAAAKDHKIKTTWDPRMRFLFVEIKGQDKVLAFPGEQIENLVFDGASLAAYRTGKPAPAPQPAPTPQPAPAADAVKAALETQRAALATKQ